MVMLILQDAQERDRLRDNQQTGDTSTTEWMSSQEEWVRKQ